MEAHGDFCDCALRFADPRNLSIYGPYFMVQITCSQIVLKIESNEQQTENIVWKVTSTMKLCHHNYCLCKQDKID